MDKGVIPDFEKLGLEKGAEIALVMNGHITGTGLCRSLLEGGDIVVCCMARSMSPAFAADRRIIPIRFKLATDIPDILKALNAHCSKVIPYPCGDSNFQTIVENADELTNFSVPFKNLDILKKGNQLEVARSCEISVPSTVIVEPGQEWANDNEAGSTYVIKPESSGIKVGFKAIISDDTGGVKQLIDRCHEKSTAAIVSQYIPGEDINLVTCGGYAHRGELLGWFTGRKCIQRPPARGVACVAEAYDIPEIVELSRRFLESVRHTGLFQLEYKCDANTDKYYFIEFNPRNWSWARLAALSGRNIAVQKYRMECQDVLVELKEQQDSNYFYFWGEAALFNLITSGSFKAFSELFRLLGSKKISFSLTRGLNPTPAILSYFNLLRYRLRLLESPR